MEKIQIVTPKFFVKSKTNGGKLAKQYFTVAQMDCDKSTQSLMVEKLVYSDEFDAYLNEGYKLLRTYKGMGLFITRYAIKLETLNTVIGILNSK